MKLGDIESKKLLPRFAHDSEWVQLAFDVIVKNVYGRSKSIDAPLTLEAIQALTDEELQVLYDQFGIVKYYPDLSRETRDKMLFELARLYRYLGTPKAIETLCKYIFDGIDLNVKIEDNKAFDEFGNLVRPDLIDTFDAIVSLNEPSLGTNSNARILENVINFSRNSQYLNGIDYDFSEVFTVYVSIAINDNNPACTIDILNDVICEPVTPPEPETQPYYMVVNETTGEIVYSISETEENPSMVFSQVGHIEMPDSEMITVYETGVPVQSFYFTTNGRNETQNTNISHADIPVYFEDGTAPAADTPYDGSSVLAFMDVTGNTKQADGESLYVDDGELRLDAPDTDEGEQWAALVESKDEFDIECNFGDAVTVPSGYRVKSVKSTDAFAFGHGTDSGSAVTVEYLGENTYSSDISQTDINTSGTPGMYIFQMNRNEFPIWGFKLIPNANVTSLSDISVNQNGNFVKLSGTSSYASTIATNANSYPGLFKYQNSSGTVVPQFFNVPSSLWKFENGTFSWLGNTSSPADLAYWYYNDAPYAGIVVTLTNEPEPTPSELTAYLNASKTEIGLSINEKYLLYDESGNLIPYDSSKTYVITAGISTNQSHPSFTPEELALFSLVELVNGGNDYLAFQTGSSIPYYNGIQSIKYTES